MNNSLSNKEESLTSNPNSVVSQQQVTSEETVVKWLYPQALQEEEHRSIDAEMASQDQAKEIVKISTEPAAAEEEQQLPTTAADEQLPQKAGATSLEDEEIDVTEEITKQVTAGANYVGNMFTSGFTSAWSKTQKAADSGIKASTSLFNFAAGYDLNKGSDDEDEGGEKDDEKSGNGSEPPKPVPPKSSSSFFSSALSKLEDLTTTWTSEEAVEDEVAAKATDAEATSEEAKTPEESKKGGWTTFGGLGDLSSIVKVATDATSVIKAKVQSTTLLSEFNREQEEFIRNKGEEK